MTLCDPIDDDVPTTDLVIAMSCADAHASNLFHSVSTSNSWPSKFSLTLNMKLGSDLLQVVTFPPNFV